MVKEMDKVTHLGKVFKGVYLPFSNQNELTSKLKKKKLNRSSVLSIFTIEKIKKYSCLQKMIFD